MSLACKERCIFCCRLVIDSIFYHPNKVNDKQQIQYSPIRISKITNSKFVHVVEISNHCDVKNRCSCWDHQIWSSWEPQSYEIFICCKGLTSGNPYITPFPKLFMKQLAQVVHSIRSLVICTVSTQTSTNGYTTPFMLNWYMHPHISDFLQIPGTFSIR